MNFESLWNYSRPAESEVRLRDALVAAEGAEALVLRTQVARALGLQGRFAECAEELDRAQDELDLTSVPQPIVQCYILLERARMHRSSGDQEAAVPLFLQALEDSLAAGLDGIAADAAHMLAIVGPPEDQLVWAQRALEIATASAHPQARRWVGPVENNFGWTLHGLDRFEEAQVHFDRALAAYRAEGNPERVRTARWVVARGLRSLGRLQEALEIQRKLEAVGPPDGYVEDELAELLRALGQPEEAEVHAERARALHAENPTG